jgi:acyl-CoA oxidase
MPADFTDRLRPAEPTGPDTLATERVGSSLPVEQLAQHLLDSDGSGFLQRQERVLQVLRREKVFSKDQQQNLSRPDKFKLGLARAKLIKRLQVKLGWNEEDRAMSV